MENKCPKCGTTLVTRILTKQLGSGSIDYPVAQVCPNCNWNRDLTGAGDLKPSPPEERKEEIKKEVKKPPAVKIVPPGPSPDFNKIITVALAIIVLAGIVWAFYPLTEKPAIETGQNPAPEPSTTPVPTVIQTPAVTEVAPTGNEKWILLDRFRIYRTGASKIRVGDKVIWKNLGKDPFNLVSNDIPDFGVKPLDYEKQIFYIFKKPGTYGFYIKENKNVNGTIVVET